MSIPGNDGEYHDIEDSDLTDDAMLAELLAEQEADLADPRCLTPRKITQDYITEIKAEINWRKEWNEVK